MFEPESVAAESLFWLEMIAHELWSKKFEKMAPGDIWNGTSWRKESSHINKLCA